MQTLTQATQENINKFLGFFVQKTQYDMRHAMVGGGLCKKNLSFAEGILLKQVLTLIIKQKHR